MNLFFYLEKQLLTYQVRLLLLRSLAICQKSKYKNLYITMCEKWLNFCKCSTIISLNHIVTFAMKILYYKSHQLKFLRSDICDLFSPNEKLLKNPLHTMVVFHFSLYWRVVFSVNEIQLFSRGTQQLERKSFTTIQLF